MLQQMRRLPKWFSTIFFGIIALSFGVWGIADIFRGSTDTSVATVGRTKIDEQAFSRIFDNVRRNAAAHNGGQLPPSKVSALGRATLQREISDTALDNVADKIGLVTTDDEVSATIRTIPAFRGVLGSFDRNVFVEVLNRMNFTEAGFVAEIRRELTRDQLQRAGSSGAVLPPGYARAIFAYLNERRAVQYIALPPDAAGAIQPPSDQVLTAYVKAHQNQFSTPEYRELTYAVVGPEDEINKVQVSDAQIRQLYDLRKDTYVIPEKRGIQRINFSDEASAKAARAKIDAGAKFEDIAKARGTTVSDLNLGSLTKSDLGPIQGPAAFALPVGGISEPVKYTFGWSLLRVTDITPGKTTTYDQAKPELKDELVKQLAQSRLEDVINAYDDAHNLGDDFVQAAKKVGMRVVHVPQLDSHGLAPDGSKAAVPTTKDFLDQTFKSDVGMEGDPFMSSDGHYYIIKVDGVIPEKLKPLDVVRAQATAAWTEEQRIQALAKKAGELAKAADASGSLAAIAAQYHVSPVASEALMRDTPTAALDQNLITKIFSVPGGKTVFGPTTDGKSYIVARVTGVLNVPLPLGDPRYQQFVQSMGEQVGKDVEESMSNAARAQQGVTINEQQLEHVLGNEGS